MGRKTKDINDRYNLSIAARGLKRMSVLVPADKEKELKEIVRQYISALNKDASGL